MRLLCVLFFLVGIATDAQSRTTSATKILAVVSQDLTEVQELLLFEDTKDQKHKETLLQKYPKHRFYLGVLKGNFQLEEGRIVAEKGTQISLYTNREVYLDNRNNFYKNFSLGDTVKLGDHTAKVIMNKGGELNFKIQLE